ncbi:anthrone oxygenase family protein [Dyadobacter bucti]|uniref:anthrone oxygenase family protein n=1 Tax=Dyadobacter bucti TaxID=2572203 RepID=UPI003F730A80
MTLYYLVLMFTGATTALIAGLFFAYSCSVNLGLGLLPDAGYLSAMQSINRAILNPVFFIAFFSPLLLLPLSAYLSYSPGGSVRFTCFLTATVLYFAGVFGVTVFGNVPLNEALDAFNIHTASADAIRAERQVFEKPWNRLNMVRTIVSLLTLLFVLAALLAYPKSVLSDLLD